jgi:hypothetical protein
MGTIVVWAFFIFWGGALIQSVLHRNFILVFNFTFEMYVVREFVVGNVEVTWKTIVAAIFGCWLALVLSCIPSGIARTRRQARWECEAKCTED